MAKKLERRIDIPSDWWPRLQEIVKKLWSAPVESQEAVIRRKKKRQTDKLDMNAFIGVSKSSIKTYKNKTQITERLFLKISEECGYDDHRVLLNDLRQPPPAKTSGPTSERLHCMDCDFYEELGRRFLGDTFAEDQAKLIKKFLGRYWSFNRMIKDRSYDDPKETEHRVVRNEVEICLCAKCGRPLFRVLQRRERKWREGALFHKSDRIHIILIGDKYMPHAIVKVVEDLSNEPLTGIALFDEEASGPGITARRISLVKAEGNLGQDEDLYKKMNDTLVGQDPRVEGAIIVSGVE